MPFYTLHILTPEKVFFEDTVESVVLPTIDGEIGVWSSHALTVVALDTAAIRIKTKSGWREAAISGGFAEIKGTEVIVLADTAEWPEEIEINRALEDKRRAEERIFANKSDMEFLQSQVALKRALTRIKVANNYKK